MATKSKSATFAIEARHFLSVRPVKSAPSLRPVPAFSIESLQKNTYVMAPPKAQKNRSLMNPRATSFRMYYDRGDLPIKMEYLTGGDKIAWTVDIDKLDYALYLPLFFDGLSETRHPYKTYAHQGVQDLLSHGGDKIYPVIPQLIIPIKNALNTRNTEVMCVTLRIMQQLVMASDLIGPALVPFYRQLLPMFNAYKVKNINSGDAIDYGQKNNMNVGDLIDETLQVLERHGGEDAFINIKYMVPTYESCYLN
ncbi:parkin coregulated gene protein homolog [Toxorhynchites rutilus septentrionalis]|uniref:parkin coregulated gene protein homolog n=1 Tax=Toxorhynchites rutilus septentrionalis TaxID=329112 RepID=UPI002478A792|nr:parkin coregulated gene protein homolog [Toxorhynchites rutilus septentrionalis]